MALAQAQYDALLADDGDENSVLEAWTHEASVDKSVDEPSAAAPLAPLTVSKAAGAPPAAPKAAASSSLLVGALAAGPAGVSAVGRARAASAGDGAPDGASVDVSGTTRALGAKALSRSAELDARLAAADAERRAVARLKKINGQRRARMAKNLHGFDDDEVVEMLGMRAILKDRAAEKRQRAQARCWSFVRLGVVWPWSSVLV